MPLARFQFPAPRRHRTCLGLIVTMGLAAVIWMAHFDRWSPAAWRIPTDYAGDALEMLARLQAAAEGTGLPLTSQMVDRLGAPFGASWNAYPASDKVLVFALGQVSRLIGLYPAANLAYLLGLVTSAAAFFLVARRLGAATIWAAAGALVFAFNYNAFHRGLAHLTLVFNWTLPVGLWLCLLVARRSPLAPGWRGWIFPLAASAAIGLSNPYNLFFWLQLLGFAWLAQLTGRRVSANLRLGGLCALVAVTAFFVGNAELWLHQIDQAARPLIDRNYAGTERFALKAVEMFIPPPFHRWEAFAFFGNRYFRWSEWRGETFLPYLGLVAGAAFVALAVIAIQRLLRGRPVPAPALQVGWLIAYGSIGGITNLLAFYGDLQVFRATNRLSVFIACIVLLAAARAAGRLTRRWPTIGRGAAAAGIAALGLLDATPAPPPATEAEDIARAVTADRDLAMRLEARLGPDAALFQLPVLGFPETQMPANLGDYDQLRLFLNSPSLHFSHGAPKFRSRSQWQRDLAPRPTERFIQRLERHGFEGLALYRRAWDDHGQAWLNDLATLGYTETVTCSTGDVTVVVLHPDPEPTPPVARLATLGQGWYRRSVPGPQGRPIRWAFARGHLNYYNPLPHPVRARINLLAVGVDRRPVDFYLGHQRVATAEVLPTPGPLPPVIVELAPGSNAFALESPEPAQRVNAPYNALRSIGVIECEVEILDPAES